MTSFSSSVMNQTARSLALGLGVLTGALPLAIATALPSQAQTTFADVSSTYWAETYITTLAQRGIISGFPDGSFGPDQPVTRAQFAALVQKAFPQAAATRSVMNFGDVPGNYWATPAIQTAYTTGFLSGYPDNSFQPNQNIPRVQALVSLANGLNYAPSTSVNTILGIYQDAAAIPDYAQNSVAAATEQRMVVNYPNVAFLNPNRPATRAEVAAFIYQALTQQGTVASIDSPYVAGVSTTPVAQVPQSVTVPAGTVIPLRYDAADKIYVAPDEPNPVPVTLLTDRSVQTQNGQVLIPANSKVVGELRSTNGGSQFYAQRIELADGRQYAVNASSNVITETETIRKGINAGRVVRDAAIGAGAAAAIAGVTGDRTIEAKEVLGGAGIGAIAGVFLEKNSVDLIVIKPETALNLTIDSAFDVQ